MEEMLSMLLDGAVELLDIAPHMREAAVARYEDVGTWLAENGNAGWRIHPQGSFTLGTVVRPNTGTGEYDIDLVCLLPIAKENTTQAELKHRMGVMLRNYRRWKEQQGHSDGPKTVEERRRCWTLHYPDDGFHLDVLPTIPDAEYPPTGILLTDKQLRLWQHSNPIGYAEWFKNRCLLSRYLVEAAAKRHVNVADVPEWDVSTPLQRVVQVLKWHTMLRFADDLDNRPPSVLVTTLAARAYAGERDLFAAARAVLAGMGNHIENRNGRWWVPNPAHEEENFADKWNEYPERREAFIAWHHDLSSVLDDVVRLEGKGLPAVAARLSESFGADQITRSAQRLGERMNTMTRNGALRMGAAGLLSTTAVGPRVPKHTFHGQRTNPRG
jgi:hypothetical protein